MTDLQAILDKGGPWEQARIIGGQLLINGDCREVMAVLPRADAVLTDPPYGIRRAGQVETFTKSAKHKRRLHDAKSWDESRPAPEVFKLMLSASEGAIIWGGNYFADLLPPSMRWLYWDKGQDGLSMSDGELAWTSQQAALRAFKMNRSAIARDGAQHPTQKPIALMEWCLGFLPDAQTILDPFVGSGTVAVACQRLGRQSISIELDADYWAIMCKRVQEVVNNPPLFVPAPPKPTQDKMDL